MAGIDVRNARAEERPAIEAMVIAAYEEFSSVLSPPIWNVYKANIERTMEAAGLNEILVAVESGGANSLPLVGRAQSPNLAGRGPLGSVLLYERAEDYMPEWWSVRLLAVHPDARGQGVGRLLMEECIRRAREGGGKVLGLHTTDMMAVAQAMYERMGFERVPELDMQLPENLIKAYRLDL